MLNWLKGYKPVREYPRLWIETIWLVESREPLELTRTIDLHPGLNVVWAKESTTAEAPSLSSAGHGVGKTSLCLLMRYLLGDDAPAISALREKASGNFPKGGVAARVHVEDACWLVYRPYGGYSQSLAAQCEMLESLLQGEAINEFPDYLESLESFSIGRLATQFLPGTDQALKWKHLLAWCIREQRTRFDGFYHWREGEGLGFTHRRRDPPLFVGSVLGLVDVEQDRLLRETESTQTQLEREKAKIPDLERAPAFALAHADRQLRARVRALEDEPVFRTLLGESIESRVQAALEAAQQEERVCEKELEQAENGLVKEQLCLNTLNKVRELAEVDVGIARSLVDAKKADFERLTNLRSRLEGLDGGRCDHGDVEFSECDHIRNRKNSVSMAWHRDGKEAQASAAVLAQQLAQRETDFKQAAKAVIDQSRTISDSQAALRRVHMRIATSVNSRTLLKQAWDELQLLYSKREQGTDSAELVETRNTVQKLEQSLDKLKTDMAVLQAQHSQRLEAVESMTACVSTRLLGREGRARFVRGHELRPFEVARGGEAYQVLEVLLGDIVCLLDSVVSNASAHPGFLVHDCPREADMSERLYKEFFLAASEAAEQLASSNGAPFQFIVTTTSPPPEELRSEKYIVLELEPETEENLLFKRQLIPELPLA